MLSRLFRHVQRQWLGALALLLVLSSGTAIALQGHNTVFSDDITNGEVKSADVQDNGLTGGDINEQTLTGDARKLIYVAGASNAAPTPIATVGPYAIKGQCFFDGQFTRVRLWANGPAGTADTMYGRTLNDNIDQGTHSSGLLIPANTNLQFLDAFAGQTDYERAAGTTMLRSGPNLVEVEFHAVADDRPNPGTCFIYGTASKAT